MEITLKSGKTEAAELVESSGVFKLVWVRDGSRCNLASLFVKGDVVAVSGICQKERAFVDLSARAANDMIKAPADKYTQIH